MSYQIYRGYISEVVFEKTKNGITSYKIRSASSSNTKQKNLTFTNIKHGFTSDPVNSNALYPVDTQVYFVADESGDGAIIAAVDKNPGLFKQLPVEEIDVPKLFENDTMPPLTPGDVFWKKLEGWVLLAYNGLMHLKAKIGTELILNPNKDKIELKSKRFRYTIGEHGAIEINLSTSENDAGKANINCFLFSDASNTDPNRVFFSFKLGEHEENDKFSFNMFGFDETNQPKLLNQFTIDSEGSLSLNTAENKVTLNINKEGEINLNAIENLISINGSGGILKLKDNKVFLGNENEELLDLLEVLLDNMDVNSSSFTQGGSLNPIIKQKIIEVKNKINSIKLAE